MYYWEKMNYGVSSITTTSWSFIGEFFTDSPCQHRWWVCLISPSRCTAALIIKQDVKWGINSFLSLLLCGINPPLCTQDMYDNRLNPFRGQSDIWCIPAINNQTLDLCLVNEFSHTNLLTDYRCTSLKANGKQYCTPERISDLITAPL